MSEQIPVIAVDGPSGVGKGTLSASLAKHLNWNLLDSGAIYRVLALSILNHNLPIDDEDSIAKHALLLALDFQMSEFSINILLENNDVSQLIRSQEIGTTASKIASFPKVRDALLKKQRDFKKKPGLIADGRDMGTIVFPDAEVKIFLDASAQARAERRMNQLREKGNCAKFDGILQEIMERDDRDRNRAVAPLRAAHDALVIDSTSLTIDEVLGQALNFIKQKINY